MHVKKYKELFMYLYIICYLFFYFETKQNFIYFYCQYNKYVYTNIIIVAK